MVESVDRLSRLLISRKTGLVRRLVLTPPPEGRPSVAMIAARMADCRVLPMGGAAPELARGHLSLSACFHDALLESAERYCAAFVDYSQLIRARPTSHGPFLFGERFPLYAERQYQSAGFPFRRLTEDSDIYWAMGRSLVTGRPAYVPAAFVYVPYRATREDEWLGPSTSTGMACHGSWARACLEGIYEVCERDAFAILWANRLSLPRLRVEPESCFGRELARSLRGNSAVVFVRMTNDLGVPAVMAVLETWVGSRRLITIGLGAGASEVEAARSACHEAIFEACRQGDLVVSGAAERWKAAPDFSNVVDWEWHSLVYLQRDHQEALAFLTASPEEEPISDGGERAAEEDGAHLTRVLTRMANLEQEVVAVDLTTREIREVGLQAVKVFVPGAVPLHPDHRYPWLSHRRLYQVPRLLGHRSRDTDAAELNPMPHPFA